MSNIVYVRLLFGAVSMIFLNFTIVFSALAAETNTAQSAPIQAPQGEPESDEDEWDAPDVEKPKTGRDEDARRRLMEIETWRRKMEAEKAKKEEEEAEKVRFEFSGKYKPRLNIRDNLNLNNPGQFWEYDRGAYFDQRFQLKIDAIYGPLTMVMLFDKGNYVFDWKEGSEGTFDRWSEFFTVDAAWVRELYLQFTGPLVVQVGRKNIVAGNGGVVLEGPSDMLSVSYPLGKTPIGITTLSLTYIAVSGGYSDYTSFRKTGPPAGDRSALFGIANKMDGFLFNASVKPGKHLSIESYALKLFDRGGAGDSDLNLDKDFDMTTMPRDGGFEPLWLGAAVSGRGERISYSADLVYLSGSYTKERNLSAYAAMLRVDYDFKSKGLSTGFEWGMGSGNKADDTGNDDYKDFSALWMCKDRRKFGNIFSEDLRAGYFLWSSNLSNVTFARAIIEMEPVKKLKTTLSVVKLWTTQSVYKGHGPVGDWSNGAALSTEQTRDIGWEFDLNFDFELLKRLNGFMKTGYLVPSDVYQLPDGKRADPASEIVIGAEFVF